MRHTFYTVVFRCPGADPETVRKLRALLKYAGRTLGLRAVSVRTSQPSEKKPQHQHPNRSAGRAA
jgi:hypothetical protein